MTPITELPSVRAYLERIDATVTSIRSATIRERVGSYYRDITRIVFSKDGSIRASKEYAATEEEAKSIAEEINAAAIPEPIAAPSLRKLPFDIKDKEIFEFKDDEGKYLMLQERIINSDGSKRYVPWTYWSDKEWRQLEPEDNLPLYNAQSLEDSTVVFIHEGPKSVRDLLIKLEKGNHPWQDELENVAHVGWIGGALNPYRTNWRSINKAGATRAYIVADNDDAGLSAIKHVSRYLRCITWSVQFNDNFPKGFDLGDDFPEAMFSDGYYNGPVFRSLTHPSTWMTDPVPKEEGEKGRTAYTLRKSAEAVWIYSEVSDQFVLAEQPEVIRTETSLNKMLMPYSHVDNTCRLICKAQSSRKVSLAYRPDTDKKMIEANGTSAINTHIPCLITARKGDLSRFIDFLEFLIPDERERGIVEKWSATLIARPGIRMGFAMLMISEKQGVGKTTLGLNILGPLMGPNNSSTPRESDVVSDYNEWIAHKRLSIVNEIYMGHGWRAYQILQSIITDNKVMVNQKYVRQYEVDNWCHIYACSNSIRALKIRREDRRWFVPKITETKRPKAYWEDYHSWLEKDGLGIIRLWAENYGDYFTPGEHAPQTRQKKEMIEDSESESWKEGRILGGLISDLSSPVAIPMRDIMAFLRAKVKREVHESDAEIRRAIASEGAIILPERVKVDGARQYIVGNTALLEELEKVEGPDGKIREFIRSKRMNPNDLVTEPM